ncbi:hypothetical protein ACFVEN_07625 [Streptomyces sp. NPDC057681]|uniref:hypothetical protein n=1 Tax=Streptomyces sp. NPDC057681 TaxID=3346209 RepID=UPI003687F352
MIRIVTTPRLESLECASRTAREQVREVAGSANEAFGEHVRELYAVIDRAERAEATASEVAEILARTRKELSAAREELLLKDIEIRRLREELEGEPVEGQTLTLLSHYGEPHTVYASREEAEGDTATHGVPADAWVPASGRPEADVQWRCESFIYDAASKGFRRVFMAFPEPVGGAA